MGFEIKSIHIQSIIVALPALIACDCWAYVQILWKEKQSFPPPIEINLRQQGFTLLLLVGFC